MTIFLIFLNYIIKKILSIYQNIFTNMKIQSYMIKIEKFKMYIFVYALNVFKN